MTAPVHIFTVDVEDWYQGLDLDMDEWARFAPRLETGLGRLLDLLADAGARTTFFVVAPRRTRSTSRASSTSCSRRDGTWSESGSCRVSCAPPTRDAPGR